MALKPWYKVVTPREDLREGKPLDASEFAVHLDQVRDGRAPTDYQNPERFFERTYLTNNLTSLAAEVIRRLSGEKTETSAVFNMSTQFGGGKTHALTLLYHLATHGPAANGWSGVKRLLDKAAVSTVPKAQTAVFVGTEFDSITGRGGNDGTPLRKTPWGEIAFQLGGAEAFAVVAEHEKQLTAPAGEVIRRFLPKGQPCLILLDALMNYVSRSRKSGLATQLYSFLHNLSEEARGHNNVVLAVSIPASELEMSAEDQSDYERFKKLLDRVGKAVIMSAEAEASEIIRLAVAEPALDIGNVETVIETLSSDCYYLSVDRNRYRFSLSPNLNKLLADRRASIQPEKINERVRAEVQKVFAAGSGVERVFFPDKSGQVPDRPAVTLVVLSPDQAVDDPATLKTADAMTREYGTSARTFKSALVWCVPDNVSALSDEARKALAWEDIQEEDESRLDEAQKRQLAENLKKAQRDLREAVWRTYKNVVLLGKDNKLRNVDLGLVHSSAANSMITLIINRLRQDGDVEAGVSPTFLVRNWPPAFKEWSTKNVRDAFFASPQFPRLLDGDAIKDTIARGVSSGLLAYVGKTGSGGYDPFIYSHALAASDVEVSEDALITTKDTADAYEKTKTTAVIEAHRPVVTPSQPDPSAASTVPHAAGASRAAPAAELAPDAAPSCSPLGTTKLTWTGEVPAQKWMNFYTKVLAKFASSRGLKLTVTVEASPDGGVPTQKLDETRVSLRELGLNDSVRCE